MEKIILNVINEQSQLSEHQAQLDQSSTWARFDQSLARLGVGLDTYQAKLKLGNLLRSVELV